MELTWLLISVFGFALFDFFGYNISVKKNWVDENFLNPYRIIQTIIQIFIFVLLLGFVSPITAIAFMILWFTFNCDWIYYLYCIPFGWIFGITSEWKQPFKNVIRWGWWTAYGLVDLWIRGKENGQYRVIKWPILVTQSLFGIIILLKIYNII